ncbi:MAG: 7TM diverse intracellular signaling domain-containing protein [Bacteroidia bacterium]
MKRFLLLLFVISGLHSVAQHVPRLIEDLGKHDFAKEPVHSLNGSWEIYYQRLLFPEDFKTPDPKREAILTKPSSWGDIRVNGKALENKGYATYRITLVHLPAEELVLDAYSMQTSYRIFINGKLSAEVGRPGKDLLSTVPMNRDVQVSLPLTDTVEIIVQAANFHHRKGGFVHPFEIGTRKAITKQRMTYYLLDVTETSALAIIGLFLLALFIFRRKDLSILYFALFCITLSFRPVIAVNYLLSTLVEQINWSLMLKTEYLAMLFPCLFMLLFIRKLFTAQFPKLLFTIFRNVLLTMIIIVAAFPPSVFSWLVLPILIIIPAGVTLFAITIIRAIVAQVEGARYAGFGLATLLLSLILKVTVYAGLIEQVQVLITLLDVGFIFMMSLILGSRFSLQFSKVERLQIKTELQHLEIQNQKIEVEKQKEKLEEKNKSIIDSINYAKRIQNSLLTSEKYIERKLKELRKNRKGS